MAEAERGDFWSALLLCPGNYLLTRRFSIAPPNFISDIFYLTLAANHIGQLKLVNNIEELLRQYDDVRRHLEVLQSDQSWRGVRYSDSSACM